LPLSEVLLIGSLVVGPTKDDLDTDRIERLPSVVAVGQADREAFTPELGRMLNAR